MNCPRSNFSHKLSLILVLLSMSLSACAKAASLQTTAPTTDQKTAPLPSGGSDSNQGIEGNVVITFVADQWQRSTYEPLMEAFHQLHPDITVQFAPLPEFTTDSQGESFNYELTLASAGDTSMTYNAKSDSASQYFLDLSPLMEGDPAFDPTDFWTGALDACQDTEGRSMGIPTTVNITGIFYDEAAFTEAGVPAPRSGWTWDEFRAAVAALAKSKNGQVRYGFAEQNFNMLLWPHINSIIANSGGEIETDPIQQEFQWYLDLVNSQAIYPPVYADDAAAWEESWKKWQELFNSDQRPAMWIGQISESLPGAEFVFDESDPFKNSAINTAGFAPFPVAAGDPNEKTSLASTQCLAVSKGSLHPRAAWTWINFLSQQWTGRGKNQAYDLMQIPARISTVEANQYWDLLPEKAVPALKFALEHAWYQPGYYVMETSMVLNALSKASSGYGDLDVLLAEAREQIKEVDIPTHEDVQVVVATVQPTTSPDAEVVKFFANLSGKEEKALTELASRYNDAHPDQAIKITTQLDVQGDWFPVLAEQFDCFYWYSLDPNSQNQASLLPLDSFFEGEGIDFTSDYSTDLLRSYTYDGQLYGLPVASDFQMMAYNKDLLASKGMEFPANDWTYEDFTRMLEKLGGGEGEERTYGYKLDMWDESLFNSSDVQWVDAQSDPPVLMLNSPEMVNFVQRIVTLKNTGGIYLQTPENYMESDELFRNGKIAFFLTYASQPDGYYFVNGEAPFEIGLAPFPVFNDQSGAFFTGYSRAYMISRNAQNPQACWDWITFLSDQPTVQLGVPARHSVMESSNWEAVVGKENAAAMRAAMGNLRSPQGAEDFGFLTYPLGVWRSEAIRKALAGEEIQTVLDAAQGKSEIYLDCMAGVELDQTSDEEFNKYLDKLRACALQADPEGANWRSGP